MRDEPRTVKFPTAALWNCSCYFVARCHTAAAEVGTSGNMTSDSMQNRTIGFPTTPFGMTDGAGHSSKPTHPISRSRLTSRKTAWVVIFRLSQRTGCTYKVTRSSNRNGRNGLVETHSRNASGGEVQCKSICWQSLLDLD